MTLHTKLSYMKSGIRIAGFVLLPFSLVAAAVALVIAEIVGVAEELPGAYRGTKT